MEFSPLWDIAVVRMVTGVAAVAEVCAVVMILVSTFSWVWYALSSMWTTLSTTS